MKGTAYDAPTDWLEFDDPKNELLGWKIHLPFIYSNWGCIFGNGCPGIVSSLNNEIHPDRGCCTHGAYVADKKDRDQIEARVAQLTAEDVGPNAFDYIRKNGWLNTFSEVNPEDPTERWSSWCSHRG